MPPKSKYQMIVKRLQEAPTTPATIDFFPDEFAQMLTLFKEMALDRDNIDYVRCFILDNKGDYFLFADSDPLHEAMDRANRGSGIQRPVGSFQQ